MPDQAVSPAIHAQAVVLEPTGSLLQHPSNARMGDVGAISESIRANGYMAPVVAVRSSRFVIDGNHRLQAAAALGMEQIPVVWVDVDDDTALRYLLAANRTNDLAAYDDLALVELLAGLQESPTGLAGTGYEPDDLDHLVAVLNEPMPDVLARAARDPLQGHTEHWCPGCGHQWTGSCTPEP